MYTLPLLSNKEAVIARHLPDCKVYTVGPTVIDPGRDGYAFHCKVCGMQCHASDLTLSQFKSIQEIKDWYAKVHRPSCRHYVGPCVVCAAPKGKCSCGTVKLQQAIVSPISGSMPPHFARVPGQPQKVYYTGTKVEISDEGKQLLGIIKELREEISRLKSTISTNGITSSPAPDDILHTMKNGGYLA